MRTLLFWFLLGFSQLGHAHVGNHQQSAVAVLVHAFSALTPFLPAIAVLLIVWAYSRVFR